MDKASVSYGALLSKVNRISEEQTVSGITSLSMVGSWRALTKVRMCRLCRV